MTPTSVRPSDPAGETVADRRADPTARRVRLGVLLFVVLAVVGVVIANKSALLVHLRPGETVKAEFARSVDIQVGAGDVKIAGTKVGKVSGVDRTDEATVIVTMKVDHGTREKLGTAPTAAIRPVTVLGGRYYIDLDPGGERGEYPGETIPVERTSTPVELPDVLSSLQPSSREGLRRLVDDLDATLAGGGSGALQDLARTAPATLRPAGEVIEALSGTRPGTDLPELVTNLERVSATLTREDGQLEALLESLSATTAAAGAGGDELAAAVADLPETLRSTRSGMARLDTTLDKLAATAPEARPVARELDETLERLEPVLADARPVVADLRPLLADARPAVEELVPVSEVGTAVLEDLRGPVLDRLNGPVISRLNEEWRGSGPFAGGGGNGHLVYEELGYLAVRFANLSKYFDQNGPFANLQAGFGSNSAAGTPFDRFLLELTKIGGAPR